MREVGDTYNSTIIITCVDACWHWTYARYACLCVGTLVILIVNMVKLSEELKRPSAAHDAASPDVDSAALVACEDQVIIKPLVASTFVKGA
jgi:hypothetical protein